ncbi:hypothetical protein WEM_00592 [Escherichia coli KTE27]|nr:hypothetical protein WEM_00592 [Escherichia coli KTE27]RIC46119.1 hypothetical protein D1899_01210 [Escherichia coli]RIC69836.1 hypothetical protein D1896_01205 [Escherichia coli]
MSGLDNGLYPTRDNLTDIPFKGSRYSSLTHHALYRRRIPALTETAARQGDSSARVCGDNQKRYTPGFTALTERGVVPS